MKHYAKKSLGQNFLKSQKAISTIVDEGDVNAGDIILEIGPGKGILTERLLFLAGKVIAVEKDRELIEFLKEKFKNQISTKKLDILEKDILDFDPEILKYYKIPYKIIANIPYYITGAILKKFLSVSYQPQLMILLVQKEVAERIMAKDGKESILSISVKVFGRPEYVQTVKKGNFTPIPKVDSAILAIRSISKNIFSKNKISEARFFEIVRAGFAHKRKMLMGNLKDIEENTENLKKIFAECGIDAQSRAEDLSLENWICLVKNLSKNL